MNIFKRSLTRSRTRSKVMLFPVFLRIVGAPKEIGTSSGVIAMTLRSKLWLSYLAVGLIPLLVVGLYVQIYLREEKFRSISEFFIVQLNRHLSVLNQMGKALQRCQTEIGGVIAARHPPGRYCVPVWRRRIGGDFTRGDAGKGQQARRRTVLAGQHASHPLIRRKRYPSPFRWVSRCCQRMASKFRTC